jgi:hypothetical protein
MPIFIQFLTNAPLICLRNPNIIMEGSYIPNPLSPTGGLNNEDSIIYQTVISFIHTRGFSADQGDYRSGADFHG